MGFRRILRRLPGRVRGVIHVGAHVEQECGTYLGMGIHRQVWVEPHVGNFGRLVERLPRSPEIRAFNVACGESDGFADLYCSPVNDGQGNTLLRAEGDGEASTGAAARVEVFSLDSLLCTHGLSACQYDLLVLDVQGSELRCLRGASGLLGSLRAVVCEVVLRDSGLVGCPSPQELRELLAGHGYRPVYAEWTKPECGNVLFVREAALSMLGRIEIKLRGGFDARTVREVLEV